MIVDESLLLARSRVDRRRTRRVDPFESRRSALGRDQRRGFAARIGGFRRSAGTCASFRCRRDPSTSGRERCRPCGSSSYRTCGAGRGSAAAAAPPHAARIVVFHGHTPGWIRTNDLRIRSPLLYPLSYRGRADGTAGDRDDPIIGAARPWSRGAPHVANSRCAPNELASRCESRPPPPRERLPPYRRGRHAPKWLGPDGRPSAVPARHPEIAPGNRSSRLSAAEHPLAVRQRAGASDDDE